MILLKRLRLSSILFVVMSSYNVWSYLVMTLMMKIAMMMNIWMSIVNDDGDDGASNNF